MIPRYRYSHIDLLFRLKLGYKIFLRSGSSSSRSFNILANEKFNQNNTLRLQLNKISPHSPSTVRRYVSEILPIRRITLSNQSIIYCFTRLHMSEKLSSGTKTSKQSNKQTKSTASHMRKRA